LSGTCLGEFSKGVESHSFNDVTVDGFHAEAVVLAVATALFSFVGPEVHTVDNVSEHMSASTPAFFDVVEVSDVSIEVRNTPSLVVAPVSLASLFPSGKSLFFPMDPFSVEVLNGLVKGIAVSIIVAVLV
jgi:hypothetical protein